MDLEGIGEEPKKERSHKLKLEILTPARRKRLAIQKRKAEREALGIKGPDVLASRRAPARDVALALVEDPKYLKNLMKRLRDGTAGPMEIWVWRYAYGDPAKSDEENKRQVERYERMRAEVLEFLKKAPERAAQLEAAVTKSPKFLPLPELPGQETMEELEEAEQGDEPA